MVCASGSSEKYGQLVSEMQLLTDFLTKRGHTIDTPLHGVWRIFCVNCEHYFYYDEEGIWYGVDLGKYSIYLRYDINPIPCKELIIRDIIK